MHVTNHKQKSKKMGWSIQGFNTKNSCWEVQGYTRGLNPEIEKYHGLEVDLKDNKNIRLFLGLTGDEYFRGYVFSGNEEVVREVLRNFNGFLVYATKYGAQSHEFDLKNLTFYNFGELTLFLEKTIFYDFEWSDFKWYIKLCLDVDKVSELTQRKILEMPMPIDYN